MTYHHDKTPKQGVIHCVGSATYAERENPSHENGKQEKGESSGAAEARMALGIATCDVAETQTICSAREKVGVENFKIQETYVAVHEKGIM